MTYMTWVILCLCLVTIVSRGVPFLLGAKLAENRRLQIVGKRLAAYIMMLLVVYQVNPASFTHYPFAWPAVASLFAVVAIHLFWHKPLLSMIAGTVLFIACNSYFV